MSGKQKRSYGEAYPPASGPGSGKDAWRDFAVEIVESNIELVKTVDELNATIGELRMHINLLQQQLASRKPRGGRLPIDDERVKRIEAALASGTTMRQIAQRYKVSAMTVSRIKRRIKSKSADFKE
jgi:DNA-binding NarL/FixJ family response regulator